MTIYGLILHGLLCSFPKIEGLDDQNQSTKGRYYRQVLQVHQREVLLTSGLLLCWRIWFQRPNKLKFKRYSMRYNKRKTKNTVIKTTRWPKAVTEINIGKHLIENYHRWERKREKKTKWSSLEIAHSQMPSILACEAVVLRYLLLVHLILLHLTREIETPSLPCSSRNRRDPLKPPQNPGLAQSQEPGLRSC